MEKFLVKSNVTQKKPPNSPETENKDTIAQTNDNEIVEDVIMETELMVLSSDEGQKDQAKDLGKDPLTPANTTKPQSRVNPQSSSKKRKNNSNEAKSQKKEDEERERREKRQKLEEERKKKKLEDEQRKQERLKREEENRKKRLEEEERKAENRRRMEELRQKREEEKIKREEEKIKQMEEKLKREEEKKQEQLEKERLKSEEKRLKDEEKKKEEEENTRKANLIKDKFAKFFVKIDTPKDAEVIKDEQHRFIPFQLKENMTQAPRTRRDDIKDCKEFNEKFDEILAEFNELSNEKVPNYLEEIRKNPKQIRKQKTHCRKKEIKVKDSNLPDIADEGTTTSVEEVKLDIADVLDNKVKMRAKYLHFDMKVYRRPPYFGTWRKRSKIISSRTPFKMDEKLIDYECDSDDEWEEIADGESIADSDKGDEEEEKFDDEDDDGFFVPHGHLSDDELDEDERMMDPEAKKMREVAKTEQWETERKKTSKYQIPRVYFAKEHWDLPDPTIESAKDMKHLAHLERLQMVPFLRDNVPSTFPMIIQTDEKIKQDQQMKQLADEAAKKAKHAAILEANASPTTTPKTKLKKKISDNGQSPLVTGTPNAATANTSSILKFVSKISNKDFIAKTTEVPSKKVESKSQDESDHKIIDSKPPRPLNKADKSPKCSDKQNSLTKTDLTNTPKSTPNKPASVINSALQTTPVSSPKIVTCTTAEKRANSSTGETTVKRMKLDEIHAKSNEKSQTPSIVSMFKNNSCRKNLQMNNNGSSDADQECLKSPMIKKHVLGPASKRHSLGAASNTEKETEPETKVTNNKENACITLD